jgi:hypothetical protein
MEPDKKSNGAVIGSVIVILILILGGVYLWTANSLKVKEGVARTAQDKNMAQLNEASAIEADLDSIDAENNANTETDFISDVQAVK